MMLHAVITAAEEAPVNPLVPEVYDVLWSSICFAIILIAFWKFFLPKMQVLLDARAVAIEGNIEKAAKAEAAAEAALAEYNKQLSEARAEAAGIRDAAREDGKRIVAEAKDQATVEAARVTAGAQAQIAAERQSAVVTLRAEVGTLALDLASGVIGESLSDDKKAAAVVDRFLADLENSQKASK
jgi:F-type H+-transporting ATPase subunit b